MGLSPRRFKVPLPGLDVLEGSGMEQGALPLLEGFREPGAYFRASAKSKRTTTESPTFMVPSIRVGGRTLQSVMRSR